MLKKGGGGEGGGGSIIKENRHSGFWFTWCIFHVSMILLVARKKSYTRFKLFRLAHPLPPPHSATVLFMKTRHHSRPTCCGNGWTIFRWIFRNYQKISFEVSIVGEARRWFAFAYRENGTLQKLSATRSRFTNRLIFLSSCNKKFSTFLHVTKQKEKGKK